MIWHFTDLVRSQTKNCRSIGDSFLRRPDWDTSFPVVLIGAVSDGKRDIGLWSQDLRDWDRGYPELEVSQGYRGRPYLKGTNKETKKGQDGSNHENVSRITAWTVHSMVMRQRSKFQLYMIALSNLTSLGVSFYFIYKMGIECLNSIELPRSNK